MGPEKGVVHLATGAVLNAGWYLWAEQERKVTTREHFCGTAQHVQRNKHSSTSSLEDTHSRPPKETEAIV